MKTGIFPCKHLGKNNRHLTVVKTQWQETARRLWQVSVRVTVSGSLHASLGASWRSWPLGESSLSWSSREVLPLSRCTEKLSEHQDAPSAPDASSLAQGYSGAHRVHSSLVMRCKIIDKTGIQTILKVFPNTMKDPMRGDWKNTVLTWLCHNLLSVLQSCTALPTQAHLCGGFLRVPWI